VPGAGVEVAIGLELGDGPGVEVEIDEGAGDSCSAGAREHPGRAVNSATSPASFASRDAANEEEDGKG
jgi:hypothetical protein